MCIYDASCDANFGFCCDIDEDAAHELAGDVFIFYFKIQNVII